MNFLRRHWYNIGLYIAIIAAIYLALAWSGVQILQRLLILNFIAMLIHQYEEYALPGGEPAIINMVVQPSDIPDRYPLNQNSAMVTNLLYSYGFCLIPIFFPNVIWLGLAPMLAAVSQLVVHGILNNLKLKSFYNPGLGAVVFIHMPVTVYYIVYIQSNGLANIWIWIAAIVYLVFYMVICLAKLTYTWLADRNSPYPFDEVEMKRFNVTNRLKRITVKQ
jgi:hypothetical protein